jgi:hypothetical protein
VDEQGRERWKNARSAGSLHAGKPVVGVTNHWAYSPSETPASAPAWVQRVSDGSPTCTSATISRRSRAYARLLLIPVL